MRLKGTVNETGRQFHYRVEFPEQASENEFIPRLWATRRVGYLMEQIRLHGENAELREEATRLARRYGVVTPYTAYLILEDERRRNVPLTRQSLPELQEDEPVRRLAESLYEDSERRKSGGAAVARSRYGLALQQADQPASGLEAGNREAGRSLSLFAASDSSGGTTATPESMSRLSGSARQSQFVGGQAFYQNGKQWIDSRVQEVSQGGTVRVRFDSPEYYELMEEEPAMRPWLALGKNLQFVWQGKVYEIHE